MRACVCVRVCVCACMCVRAYACMHRCAYLCILVLVPQLGSVLSHPSSHLYRDGHFFPLMTSMCGLSLCFPAADRGVTADSLPLSSQLNSYKRRKTNQSCIQKTFLARHMMWRLGHRRSGINKRNLLFIHEGK